MCEGCGREFNAVLGTRRDGVVFTSTYEDYVFNAGATDHVDENGVGEEGGAWRASCAQMDDGQRVHTQGSCREHQAGQG